MRWLSVALAVLILSARREHRVSPASAQAAPSPPKALTDALTRWQDMRFGMFIHWGPVSLKGTEIGWSRGAQTPIEEYDNLYKQFNPTKFNADEWVRVAKDAGMKYMVFTTKHHDGFCMWDTKQTDYNIMHSPFGRDVVKELADGLPAAGPAVRHLLLDLRLASPRLPARQPRRQDEEAEARTWTATPQYLRAPGRGTRCTNYGPLARPLVRRAAGVAVDRRARAATSTRCCARCSRDIIINNRVSKRGRGWKARARRAFGDYDTPEQRIGGFNMDRPWETCMTICQQWAWKPDDEMKSLKECLQTLVARAGGDGNLLFNVGPMPDGRIEPRQVERLTEMGAWLAGTARHLRHPRRAVQARRLGRLDAPRQPDLRPRVRLEWRHAAAPGASRQGGLRAASRGRTGRDGPGRFRHHAPRSAGAAGPGGHPHRARNRSAGDGARARPGSSVKGR